MGEGFKDEGGMLEEGGRQTGGRVLNKGTTHSSVSIRIVWRGRRKNEKGGFTGKQRVAETGKETKEGPDKIRGENEVKDCLSICGKWKKKMGPGKKNLGHEVRELQKRELHFLNGQKGCCSRKNGGSTGRGGRIDMVGGYTKTPQGGENMRLGGKQTLSERHQKSWTKINTKKH